MNFKYLFVFILYFVTIFSVIGYGKFFSDLFIKDKKFNFGYYGIFGIFFLIFYSYVSHIFYPHSQTHNLIFILLGLIFFIYLLNKRVKEIFFTSIIFLCLYISLLIIKTHDDFPYYHFGYSYYLTQNPLLIGIGQFNHGFRTQSSIFYLNSLFYLPIIKFYFFHLSALLFLGFANITFINKLLKNFKNKNIDYRDYFSLLSIIFINIFFYRIAEHGTDRSAQILVFLLIFEILYFIDGKVFNHIKLFKIFVLIGIIISLKAFYILYILTLISVFYILIKKNSLKNLIIKLTRLPITYLLIFFISILLLTNFYNTACLVYPLSFTCLENFSWSFLPEEVSKMNDWYEQWSKAGAGPNYRVDNPELYILKFNWVSNWLENYFFNKVSDFLIGVFFLISILIFMFRSQKKQKIKINKNVYILLLILFIFFIEWFYNHPALRYGGYSLIASILFMPSAIYFSKFKIKYTDLKKKFLILITLSFVIFVGRNIDRINDEVEKYNFRPFNDFSFRIHEHHYRNFREIEVLLKNYKNCELQKVDCDIIKAKKVEKVFYTFKFNRN